MENKWKSFDVEIFRNKLVGIYKSQQLRVLIKLSLAIIFCLFTFTRSSRSKKK